MNAKKCQYGLCGARSFLCNAAPDLFPLFDGQGERLLPRENSRCLHRPRRDSTFFPLSTRSFCPVNNSPRSSLPPHSVRFSRRARRISLRVLPGKGLEVVLPERADPSCVPALLHRHSGWIARHLERICPRAATGFVLPEGIALKGGAEVVRLLLPGGGVPPGELSGKKPPLTGPPPLERTLRLPVLAENAPDSDYVPFLRHWLRQRAQADLEAMTALLAREHGFCYSRVGVRFQKSRWGSCSSRKSLSLNVCLVFLPEDLMRHIILHELCHTKAMNHSEAFWKALFAVEPDALAKDRAMRGAWRYVPDWALPT